VTNLIMLAGASLNPTRSRIYKDVSLMRERLSSVSGFNLPDIGKMRVFDSSWLRSIL
jgi:hypothetical protein